MTSPPSPTTPQGRWGVWFAAIWLFFLAEPLTQAWRDRDTVSGLVGGLTTVVFAAAYLWVWVRLRQHRWDSRDAVRSAISLTAMAVLVLLSSLMIALLGESGTASTVYCAVAAVMLFPVRAALAAVLLIGLEVVALHALNPEWSSPTGLLFSVFAASLAVFGIRQMILRQQDLIRAQAENAELAVENERTRFARDLHDILGHSLTVITVKAELAGRLLDVDHERARAELADLERLSRDALADVRRAVAGYRELTLPGELATARAALESAQIEADLPNATEVVPSHARELFAWTVREGVTNVIRHSHARRCSVVLTSDRVEVRDDGVGPCSGAGNGLTGLSERAGQLDASVVTRALDPGFSLAVVLR